MRLTSGDSKRTTKYHDSANNAMLSLPNLHLAVLKWGLCTDVSDDSGGSNSNNNTKKSAPSGSASGGSVNFTGYIAQLEDMEKT